VLEIPVNSYVDGNSLLLSSVSKNYYSLTLDDDTLTSMNYY